MGSDNNRLIIALTPKDGHYIGVISHKGDFHLFESVFKQRKNKIFTKRLDNKTIKSHFIASPYKIALKNKNCISKQSTCIACDTGFST